MNFTDWLESTSVATAVNEGISAYPTAITFHSLGLGLLIGALFIIYVRVLGGFSRLPYAALPKIMRVAFVGFIVNAISGVALYVAQASTFTYSPMFILKMSLVLIGAIIALVFQYSFFKHLDDWQAQGQASGAAKIIAFLSIVFWSGAIITGRLMAYIDY